ncbi:MAG: putative lipoprotein transrane [Gammaproteobacteria bacterium]|nr:putative lipoprotein transrane [Gammaproteobacteria bacterium]
MSIQRTGLQVSAALALLVISFQPTAWAATVNPNAAHGKKVLYVYNQIKLEKARTAEPTDPKRIAQLESWRKNDEDAMQFLRSLGFTVTGANEATPVEAVKTEDFVIISETVDAVDVGTKYRYVTVPLLTFENDLLGELGMTALKNGRDYGTDDDQRFIWLVNAPHPLAAGLAAGIQNVLTDEHCKMNWGKPGLGAVTIATLRGEPEKAAIFAYEKGATMNGEFLAPARRVSFLLWQDTFDQMRPEGLALFKAAVLWAVSPAE